MDNAIMRANAHILRLAEEFLDYPLHFEAGSLEDGQFIEYVFPDKGETPRCIRESLDDPASLSLQCPLVFDVHEWDAKARRAKLHSGGIHVEIPKKYGGNGERSVTTGGRHNLLQFRVNPNVAVNPTDRPGRKEGSSAS